MKINKMTPMIEQYMRIKREHPDSILLFRVGDFYETFFDDAVVTSSVLGIVLTSREHGKGKKVPLAGIPYHSLDRYVNSLINAGRKVAICDQLEDARFAKGIVKRDVTEVITPGTAVRPSLLNEKENNFLVGIFPDRDQCGLACVDCSTGEFKITELMLTELKEELERLEPKEIIIPEGLSNLILNEWICKDEFKNKSQNFHVTKIEDYRFYHSHARKILLEHFGVSSLAGFGCENMMMGITAGGVVLEYVKKTQPGRISHIDRIQIYSFSDYLVLDSLTQKNLELVRGLHGEMETSLLSIMDRTKTPMGARLLRRFILFPLRNIYEIEKRQDVVEFFILEVDLRNRISNALLSFGDMERLISRISVKKVGPRDLIALSNSLKTVKKIRNLINGTVPILLQEIINNFHELSSIVELIDNAIVDFPPPEIGDGNFIRDGYDSILDELRNIARGGKEWIAMLQQHERNRTGIPSLKVGYNSIFGYYIEVTKPNLHRIPQDYIRKQTIVNGERFITPELKEQEAKVLSAEERIREREEQIFEDLRVSISKECGRLKEIASSIAMIDVFLSFASVASERHYRRPKIISSGKISIRAGRHPVAEKLLESGKFVSNDVLLDNTENQILLITGPNMAGKSTYLRQVALCVIIAQMGSFVPCEEAKIGIVDRIFTRIGASDDVARGVSTFLAEMQETANILHNATKESLILLDEIGRGTATLDGLALAWASVEYLHNHPNVKPMTLFATHYRELTEISKVLKGVKNYHILVKEWNEDIIFLHKISEGICDRSYGIQVARIAGIPKEVIERASKILLSLESERVVVKGKSLYEDKKAEQCHPILLELKGLDIYRMTPIQVMQKIEGWKKALNIDKEVNNTNGIENC